MEKYILNYAVLFCLRQLAKYGEKTDWSKVKADYDPRIADLVPGTMLDQAAMDFANSCIDSFALICQDTADLKKLVDAVIAGDLALAFQELKDIVSRVFIPTTQEETELKAALLAL